MIRTTQIGLVALLSFGISCLLESTACAGQVRSKPNLLLILADDLGWSDLGCYGGEIKTPNLDGLAKDGLRFTQFYNSARCCPTRASLLSGLYPHQAGMGGMAGGRNTGPPGYEGHLTERCVTIPEVLKPAGYRCYMVGKWHLNRTPNPIERGFDEFYGMLGGYNSCWQEQPFFSRLPEGHPRREYGPGKFYSTDVFADYALEFLDDARKTPDRPWFLYLAFNAAHFPLHAPEEEIAKYEKFYAQGWDKVREQRHARQRQSGIIPSGTPLTPRSLIPSNWANIKTGWADKDNPPWDSLPAERQADLARRMAVYAGMVDRMDQAIGRVLASLRVHGELANTLILFLSDNGACAEWDPFGFDKDSGPNNILHKGDDLKKVGGPDSYISYGSGWANACNTPWRLYKHYAHEGGIATPCIVHWPSGMQRRNEFESRPGHIIDIMATFAEVARANYPMTYKNHDILPMEGRSLLPLMRNEPVPPRTLFFEHEGNRAVREAQWKLVMLMGKPWELYNIETDRAELHNIAEQHPEAVSRLAQDWDQWAERSFVLRRDRATANGAPGQFKISTPQIANQPLLIKCEVDPKQPDGVILAQGGNQNGYALWLREGRLVFSVRVNRELVSIIADETPKGRFSITAKLNRDRTMQLAINGRTVAEGKAPGLIPVQPIDELSVGEDSRTAVGDYVAPNPWHGGIKNVTITPID